MTNTQEEMNRRIENGEFGTPPDLNMVNQEWANILEKEIVNRGRKSVYHGVTSLWNDSGNRRRRRYRGQSAVTYRATEYYRRVGP